MPRITLLIVFIPRVRTEWYDDEHIPLRTSSLKDFVTAARFEALDEREPKWGAMYSISDNTLFGKEEYTKLRANRSPREGQLVANLAVLDRRVCLADETCLCLHSLADFARPS